MNDEIKQLRILSFTVVLATVFIVTGLSPVSAGTVKKGNSSVPAAPTEHDDFDPNSDPLPEWLILPEGIDENRLEFKGNQNETQTITAKNGNEKWSTKSSRDGAKITYKYYESNKMQFGIRTSANYQKVIIYNSRGKSVKTVKGGDFFDEAVAVSALQDIGPVQIKLAGTDWHSPPDGKVNKARKNKKLTKRQLNKLSHKAGFRGNGKRIAVAVAQAESGGRIGAVLCNTKNPYNPRHKFERGVKACKGDKASADRGLWQINNRWHKNVSNKCSFSPKCNAQKAYLISNGGRDWKPWSTYNNGLYRQHL
jgi:hypothetical protein